MKPTLFTGSSNWKYNLLLSNQIINFMSKMEAGILYPNSLFKWVLSKKLFYFWYPVLAIPIDLKSRKPSGVYFRVYTTVTKWESSWIHTQTYASKSAKTTISRKKEHFTLTSHVAEEDSKSKINIKTPKIRTMLWHYFH